MLPPTDGQARQKDEPENLPCRDASGELIQREREFHSRFEDSIENQNVQIWAAEPVGWYRRVAALVVLALAAAIRGATRTLYQGRRKGEWGELGKPMAAASIEDERSSRAEPRVYDSKPLARGGKF